MTKRKVPINYYSRDFQSIKESLVAHAKRYYPDTFKDFSEAGFGSLMLDTVSYVGDVLSFYLDYQVNEGFLETANERENVVKIAKQMGYKFDGTYSSQGVATLFSFVPANSFGNDIDERYLPTIKRGSTFKSESGVQFILVEDVVFNPGSEDKRVARVDENGNPTFYVVRAQGIVISGEYNNITINVEDFEEFLKVKLPIENISEVISVFDSEGNEYFEVEHLSQDVVFRSVMNVENSKTFSSAFMRPVSVPRRYVLERDGVDTYLQFGQGNEQSELIKEKIVDPSQRVIKMYGKNYYSDDSFDPVNLVESDKFGIVPYDTTLEIVVRTNKNTQVNIGPEKLNSVSNIVLEFDDRDNLETNTINFITNNIEITNEEPILGKTSIDSVDEIKKKSTSMFSSQNRAVTIEDYQALVYRMPNQFGSVKRCSIVKDLNSFKRNLNLYVLSEDQNGFLVNTNSVVKENLKIWLNKYKMLNDTIDILDAKIINIGIDFQIITDLEVNKYETLVNCKNSLLELLSIVPNIGQPIFINDIIRSLKNTKGVLDVVSVNIVNKTGGNYSNLFYNTEDNLSSDGRYIKIPENVIWELKYPNSDIKGVIL